MARHALTLDHSVAAEQILTAVEPSVAVISPSVRRRENRPGLRHLGTCPKTQWGLKTSPKTHPNVIQFEFLIRPNNGSVLLQLSF